MEMNNDQARHLIGSARDLEELASQLKAVLDAISYGELLVTLPEQPGDQDKHNAAVTLLKMLEASMARIWPDHLYDAVSSGLEDLSRTPDRRAWNEAWERYVSTSGNVNDVWSEAWDAVLRTPAPTHAELVSKVEMVRDRYSNDGFATPDECHDALQADICRLGGLPTANPSIEPPIDLGAFASPCR